MACRVVHRHTFHESCVTTWLAQNPTCPLCRAAVARTPVARTRDGLAALAPADQEPQSGMTWEEGVAATDAYYRRAAELIRARHRARRSYIASLVQIIHT